MRTTVVSRRRQVPFRTLIERDLPVEELIPLAIREGNRKRPIYEIHKWWARRLGSNFRMLLLGALLPRRTTKRQLWSEFYSSRRRTSLVVLDPFMGGGTSIVEATKVGARTIGNDIDPVAWFVTKKEIEHLNEEALRAQFGHIQSRIAEDLKRYYKHTTADGKAMDVTTYFWVTVIRCQRCARSIDAHPHYQLHVDRGNKKQMVFCRHCGEVAQLPSRWRNLACKNCRKMTDVLAGTVNNGRFTCECGHTGSIIEQAKPGKPLDCRLFALECESADGRTREFVKASAQDLALFEAACRELKQLRDDLPFPKDLIPAVDRYDERPISHGYTNYHQLFNPRQLLCLSKLYREILLVKEEGLREYLLLAFSDALACNNMLCAYAFGYRKLTPLFGLHAYRSVTRPVEGNVWGCRYGRGSFSKCFEKLIRGKAYCKNPYELGQGFREKKFTGKPFGAKTTIVAKDWYERKAESLLLNTDSSCLGELEDAGVDLILTDPPYYNNLPYSELSDFYYVWLKRALPYPDRRWSEAHTPYREGLLVRRQAPEEHRKFAAGMGSVLKECRRVLRSDGLMVITYHHNDWRAWIVLCETLAQARFLVTNVLPVLAEGKSGFHSDDGNIKWDAVIVCRPSTKKALKADDSLIKNVVSFAKKKRSIWMTRIDKSSRKLSKADKASLSYAFGLWALSTAGADAEAIERGMQAISSKLNGEKRPYGLFKPASVEREVSSALPEAHADFPVLE